MKAPDGVNRFFILGILLLAASQTAAAQGTREDYARADALLPWNARRLVGNLQIEPRWIGANGRFWYRKTTETGAEFVLVDPGRNTSTPAFDHAQLAEALGRADGNRYTAATLPFTSFAFADRERAIEFDTGNRRWRCTISDYRCATIGPAPAPADAELRSPDGRWTAFVRDYNIFVRETKSLREVQLTRDGEKFYEYGAPPDELNAVSLRVAGRKPAIEALWSPDSKRLLTYRMDQRRVGEFHLIQWSPPGGGRHRHFAWRLPLPGDPDSEMPYAQYVVLDVEANTHTMLRTDPVLAFMPPVARQRVWWSEDSSTVWFIREDRGAKGLHLHAADARTGLTRTVIDEPETGRATTMVQLNPFFYAEPLVRVINGGKEAIWFSERDGWSHFYLYDTATGRLKAQITRGEWVVREILGVDEKARVLYFGASGREPGRDPYYVHLYRVNLDGTNLSLLSPEEAEHEAVMDPSRQYLIDTYSTVDRAPVMVLRDATGRVVRELERADIGKLLAFGWRHPERFKLKGADAKTDIYGVLYRPLAFDPAGRYPIIDAQYPGPQTIQTPRSFAGALLQANFSPALAALGFAVVNIDGLATPLRGKAHHDVVYGHMERAGGPEDHVESIRQLAAKYPFIDLDRVGIWGHSGGGTAAARFILKFPDFFKVAVASAGSYDLRGYWAEWSEKYQGLKSGDNYREQAVSELAANLKGKLLLVHGDMDDNTHPANMVQLIDALTRADKDYDLILLPNRNHGSKSDRYFLRRMFDYFVRHLHGVEPRMK